ncbi:MAG: TonB-dependent receptor [Bacteroidota bacterium]
MRLMKSCLLVALFAVSATVAAQHTFTGKVLDQSNHENLSGVIIYVPDLKTGITTDLDGKFLMKNLPARSFLVEVKYIGYLTFDTLIDFTKNPVLTVHLPLSTVEAKGVVITGNAFSSDSRTSSYQVVPIERRELSSTSATNIINALTQIPGIAAVSTGGAISKPVIRGLGYNRVVTLNEGVRQEGNQWGDEHGIEIDQFSADRVEILKGPASLFYGSDAMGGVVNIMEPLPPSPGVLRGEFSGLYSTNGKNAGSSMMLEGNENGFIWRARASYKYSASYQTPVETVYNSCFRETDLNVMTGFNKKWGYSHLHFSHFNTVIGLIEGLRDSVSHRFVDSQGQIVPESVLKGRTAGLPFQHITHDKITSVSNIILGKDQLKINVGYQQNDRKEFADSRDYPNLFFQLQTLSYEAKLQVPLANRLESDYGISGMTQTNANKGIEFLVPDYLLQDAGAFAYFKKSFQKLTVNGGIRYDHRSVSGKELLVKNGTENDTIFEKFNASFSAVSGSLGLAWELNKQTNLKFNAGRAFRAPNIAELGANGVHEGTFRYEVGNAQLNPETSLQFDGELSYNRDYFTCDASIYYNLINNFIYQRNIGNETINLNGIEYPVYRYVQGNCLLRGFEAGIDIHPKDHFHFDNTFAFVRGTNQSNGNDLPLIPAFRETHIFRWNIEVSKNSALVHPYMYVGLIYVWKQSHYDIFETQTNAYGLLKAGLGTDFKIKKQMMHVFVEGDNLTNTKYFDHLSRLKYIGIYDMGRNLTFGVSIPFGIKN